MRPPLTKKVCVRFHSRDARNIAFSYLQATDPQSEAHLVSDVEIIINESARVPLEEFLFNSHRWRKEEKDFDVDEVGNMSMLSASDAADIRSGARRNYYDNDENPYEGDTQTLYRTASALARTLNRV
jgi:hypothetical protein